MWGTSAGRLRAMSVFTNYRIHYYDDALKLSVVMPVFQHLWASSVTHTVPFRVSPPRRTQSPLLLPTLALPQWFLMNKERAEAVLVLESREIRQTQIQILTLGWKAWVASLLRGPKYAQHKALSEGWVSPPFLPTPPPHVHTTHSAYALGRL